MIDTASTVVTLPASPSAAVPTSYVGTTGVQAPSWGAQPSAWDGVAAYAARQPTAYDPTPAPSSDTSIGSFLLEAIAEWIDPTLSTTAAGKRAGGLAAPAAPITSPAGPVTPATDPEKLAQQQSSSTVEVLPLTAMPVAATPAAAPSTQRVAMAYAAGAISGRSTIIGKARASGSELWAGLVNPRRVHVTQVPSKYNSHPTPGNRDCGPASVVMTLRMLKLPIPGTTVKTDGQRAISAVRRLAGATNTSVATTNLDLERALQRAGAKTNEVTSLADVKSALLHGSPVILNGNPRNAGAYGWKYNSRQMTPYNGAHWIAVTGFDSKTKRFIINDPLSLVGPVEVTASQLEAYRGGSMGITVSR